MSKRGDTEFLADIKEAITRIEAYTHNIGYDQFLEDKKTQDAVVRNLQIIGEAVKNITADFKKEHGNIEWKKLAGLRDKIVHHYFGINWDIVWDTAKNKLPGLLAKIKNIH
jgi:uncharacterized protein with HEPN domain